MKNKLAMSAIVGAAAGVLAGMLTAPKSGQETRADIKKKAEELKQESSKRKNQLVDTAGQATTRAKGVAQEAASHVKSKLKK